MGDSRPTGPMWFERASCSRTVLSGADAVDLLQRITTNDLEEMSATDVRNTCLIDANGRMLDLLSVWHLGTELLLMGSENQGEVLRAHLADAVSWKDDVQAADADGVLTLLTLVGEGVDDVVCHLVGELPESGRWLMGETCWCARPVHKGEADCWDIVFQAGNRQEVLSLLSTHGVSRADEHTWQQERVARGWLEGGREVDGTVIPLELDLWDSVSFDKGCFTGQEILARMESRGKLARTLVGLSCSAEPTLGRQHTEAGSVVVTSSVEHSQLGWIALALVRPSSIEGDSKFSMQGDAGEVEAKIRILPFS